MAETTVNLGMQPHNRGNFEDLPVGSYIYKDNIVQFHGSSYIYDPANFDIEHPEASATQSAPYNESPASLNTGWKVFASGNNQFTSGQKVDEIGIDNQPTPSSNNLAKSGSLFNSIIKNGVFDLTAYTGDSYATLSDALTALNNLPEAYKAGGMRFQYVQTSDNKYVQARCMAQNFTTDVTQWQGVDTKPNGGSHNLVESEGVYIDTEKANTRIFGLNTTVEWPIIQTGSHSANDDRINIFIPKGYFTFTLRNGTTTNAGGGELKIRYEGEDSDTTLGYPTIGTPLRRLAQKNIVSMGIYLPSAAVISTGIMYVDLVSEVHSLDEIEAVAGKMKDRLFNVYSSQGINFNNTEHRIEVLSNINFSQTGKVVPQNINYGTLSTETYNYALVLDTDNSTLIFKKFYSLSDADKVIATLLLGSSTTIAQVLYSSLPVKIDGVNIDTKINAIRSECLAEIEDVEKVQAENNNYLGIDVEKTSIYTGTDVPKDVSSNRVVHTILPEEEYELLWSGATAGTTRIIFGTQNNSNQSVEGLADINKVTASSGSIYVHTTKAATKFNIYLTGTNANIEIKRVIRSSKLFETVYNKKELPFEDGYFLNVLQYGNGYVTLAHDTSNTSYRAALVNCAVGDVFLIDAESSSNKALPFTFVDADKKVILTSVRYGTTGRYKGYVVTPAGATQLAVNNINKSLMSYKISGVTLLDSIKELSMQSIAQFQTDGNYDSFRLAVSANGGLKSYIIDCFAKFESSNDEYPTLQIKIGDIYTSTAYVLGGKNAHKCQQFRIPPMMFGMGAEIIVNVPSSCTLNIENFSVSEDYSCNTYDGFISFVSHLGFSGIAPSNTMIAFELARISGYNDCVCNPISGASGKIYCYHGGQSSITRDGSTAISFSVEDFHALTDSEISEIKVFGFGNHRAHYLEPIPTLEDFFILCAKTGMRPVFSCHPPFQSGDWNTIYGLAVKYNLVNKLTIKSFNNTVIEDAYNVFGNSVYGYVLDVGHIVEGTLEGAYTAMDNAVPSNAECLREIEIISSEATESIVSDIIEHGFRAGVYSLEEERDGMNYLERIKWGVTIFCDDNTPCCGLNW